MGQLLGKLIAKFVFTGAIAVGLSIESRAAWP